jgi:hypothetical protein
VLLEHLLATLAKLLGPGGARAVVGESVLMKQQLVVINWSGRRAPNLSAMDRLLLAFWSLFLVPLRAAVIIRPSTLLRFHEALMRRKHRVLFSPTKGAHPDDCGVEATQPSIRLPAYRPDHLEDRSFRAGKRPTAHETQARITLHGSLFTVHGPVPSPESRITDHCSLFTLHCSRFTDQRITMRPALSCRLTHICAAAAPALQPPSLRHSRASSRF